MTDSLPSKGKESLERRPGALSGPGRALEGKPYVRLVVTGYAIFLVAHVGGAIVAAFHEDALPSIPRSTLYRLLSSAMSPLVAIWYLVRRGGFLPRIRTQNTVLVIIIAVFVTAVYWLTVMLPFGAEHNVRAREILQSPLLDQLLILAWAPLIEETLFRGFFLEALRRQWNGTAALLSSSMLFVLSHALFWDIPSLTEWTIASFIVLIASLINGVAYMHGGLVAAVLIHCFHNGLILLTYVPDVP